MLEIGKEKAEVKINLGNKHYQFALWKSLKVIIEANDETNHSIFSPVELPMMMECMMDVSKQDEDYNITTTFQKGRAMWLALNMVAQNNMISDKAQMAHALEMLSRIALVLDSSLQEKDLENEVEKEESNVLPMVQPSKDSAHHNQSPDKGQ